MTNGNFGFQLRKFTLFCYSLRFSFFSSFSIWCLPFLNGKFSFYFSKPFKSSSVPLSGIAHWSVVDRISDGQTPHSDFQKLNDVYFHIGYVIRNNFDALFLIIALLGGGLAQYKIAILWSVAGKGRSSIRGSINVS